MYRTYQCLHLFMSIMYADICIHIYIFKDAHTVCLFANVPDKCIQIYTLIYEYIHAQM